MWLTHKKISLLWIGNLLVGIISTHVAVSGILTHHWGHTQGSKGHEHSPFEGAHCPLPHFPLLNGSSHCYPTQFLTLQPWFSPKSKASAWSESCLSTWHTCLMLSWEGQQVHDAIWNWDFSVFLTPVPFFAQCCLKQALLQEGGKEQGQSKLGLSTASLYHHMTFPFRPKPWSSARSGSRSGRTGLRWIQYGATALQPPKPPLAKSAVAATQLCCTSAQSTYRAF